MLIKILRVEKHFQDAFCLAFCYVTCHLGCKFWSSGTVTQGTGTQVLACTASALPLSRFSSPLFLYPSVSATVGWGLIDLFPEGVCAAHSSNRQASTSADRILGKRRQLQVYHRALLMATQNNGGGEHVHWAPWVTLANYPRQRTPE